MMLCGIMSAKSEDNAKYDGSTDNGNNGKSTFTEQEVSDDSESDGEYDVARNWLYANKDNSNNDDDTKDTAVNRKWTHTEQLSEDEEENNEYDIARGWLYAKSDEASKTDKSNAETLEETFGTN